MFRVGIHLPEQCIQKQNRPHDDFMGEAIGGSIFAQIAA